VGRDLRATAIWTRKAAEAREFASRVSLPAEIGEIWSCVLGDLNLHPSSPAGA
jgi:hypothetical protein